MPLAVDRPQASTYNPLKMNPLARLEGLMERALEGGLTGLLGSPLQPVELAKRLEREMEAQQRVAAGKVLVPNCYTLLLHPQDFALFATYQASLEEELAAYLVQAAGERNLTLVPRAVVQLQPDPGVRRHQPQVRAELRDLPEPPPSPSVAPPGGTLEATAKLRLPLPFPAGITRATLILLGEGRPVPIPRLPFTLGRSLDCGLPLEDGRVSRHHAELQARRRRLALVDLQSTNGTYVNGERITECLLSDGDQISLGGVELLLRLEEGT